jgi:hypothetical protein
MAEGRHVPERLLITVEPLHFSSSYVAFDRKSSDRPGPSPYLSLRARAQAIQDWNLRKQSELADAVGKPLYKALVSASPAQKRDLRFWWQFATSGAQASLRDPLHAATSVQAAYMRQVIGKDSRFYTNVVYEERGFEGHVLHLADPTATRDDAFRNHMNLYPNGVLASYKASYIDKFARDLQTLQRAGRRIVLVRLPIYEALYRIEEDKVPTFNGSMEALAQKLGVRYFNFNTADYAWLTTDVLAFTDASHMEFGKTEAFTRAMIQAIGDF